MEDKHFDAKCIATILRAVKEPLSYATLALLLMASLVALVSIVPKQASFFGTREAKVGQSYIRMFRGWLDHVVEKHPACALCLKNTEEVAPPNRGEPDASHPSARDT